MIRILHVDDEPDFLDLAAIYLERASATGSATDDGWRLRKDGSRFRADETIAASFDAAGTLRGFGSVTRETG